MRGCDKGGNPGPAPSREEFCLAYRAKKISEQYKCPLISKLKEHLKTTGLEMHERNIIADNIKNLGGMASDKTTCLGKGDDARNRDIPTIWRKHMGNIVKGSFCEMEGEWYWSKIATCGAGSS